MSSLIRSILLALGLLSGCATAPPVASADAPLADAKSRSTTYCAKYQTPELSGAGGVRLDELLGRHALALLVL